MAGVSCNSKVYGEGGGGGVTVTATIFDKMFDRYLHVQNTFTDVATLF